jgi:ATP-dependent DNA helicase RecG
VILSKSVKEDLLKLNKNYENSFLESQTKTNNQNWCHDLCRNDGFKFNNSINNSDHSADKINKESQIMKLSLNTPIEELYMVGETYSTKLKEKLNIHTVADLLYYFPFRYEDLSTKKTIAQINPEEIVTLDGQILTIQNIRTKTGKQLQKALFTDGSDTLEITWFNQPYLIKSLKPGTSVSIAGKVNIFGRKKSVTSPKYEILKNQISSSSVSPTTHTGRLVPIYPETLGVSSKWLRSRIKPLINQVDAILEDWLPQDITNPENLINLTHAIKNIHFPKNSELLQKSRERLAFDELFLLQIDAQQKKLQWQSSSLRNQLKITQKDLQKFLKSLPFDLTQDQNKALDEIIEDLNKPLPMNRLLEGDVGSGKTVVAAASIYFAVKNNTKAILMAPTEVLANQHYNSLKNLLEPLGIKIGFFTGSNKSKENLKSFDLYLGTHALLFQDLPQEKISLVIIDEQHRFGVKQRSKLIGEDNIPHVLTMTATPIPRTAALTLYGNLSLSLITQMPRGRKPIKTWVVPSSKRQSGFKWIEETILKENCQAYFIYPLIDPSDKGTMKEVKAVTLEFDNLKKQFPNLNIGLLHGKLKPKEKDEIMAQFSKGKIHILASTSVIEVGIDVPNATIIVIEGAERFGLSQLHQLRGRVGRGDKQSYCLLFTTNPQDNDKARLKAMEQTHSGIELAELDLKLRGPGELYGTVQSGFLDLKLASIHDKELINKTYYYVQKFLPKLEKFPLLKKKVDSCKMTGIKPN